MASTSRSYSLLAIAVAAVAGTIGVCTFAGCDAGSDDALGSGTNTTGDAASGDGAPGTGESIDGSISPGDGAVVVATDGAIVEPDSGPGPGCGNCAGCCVNGTCLPTSPSYCPFNPEDQSACKACATGEDCRYIGTSNQHFDCIAPLPNGSPCANSYECAGEVCSQGHCQSNCKATHSVCYGNDACCNPILTCRPPETPGGSRECCALAGTVVGAQADCALCCLGLGCNPAGPLGGAFHCGP